MEVWQLIQRTDNLRDLMTDKGNADEAIAKPQHRSVGGVAVLELVSRESIVAKCSTIVDTDQVLVDELNMLRLNDNIFATFIRREHTRSY